MARETIDFGIDLGTTNSAIARADGADAAIVRNLRQHDYTPSAVHVGSSGNVRVGLKARERVESDPDNACAEFKLQMGVRGAHKTFAASGITMTPEELSAEVLKSLRDNVKNESGELIEAAVITVPAAFELDQCDATRRAASLAGLQFAPLLQEPTAAAWAYSVNEAPDKAFWLVYDFGGGTFDAAVVKVEDGEFTVINHAGDNFLGGKLVDWALVDEILVPAAQRECGLTSLSRENAFAQGNIAKLKAAAENAKIELSAAEATDIELELFDDDRNQKVDFEHVLTRADVERVTRPLVARSIALCRKALAERGAGPDDIERVLLVGGMSQTPLLREMLADPREGLGIKIDHTLDPVTVVARGAAIFAGTQRLPRTALRQTLAPGQVALDLEYPSVGQDVDPLVGGRATGEDGKDWSGYTVEFANPQARPAWSSGQVALRADGAFSTRLLATEHATSTFTITLRDPSGGPVDTDPPTLRYRHSPGPIGRAPTLSHSIGVGLSDNGVEVLLAKDTELPARKRTVFHTTVDVQRNAGSGLIRVPIVSGERPRADRNTLIGRLDVRPDEVKRDVPAGSEIEVFVEIDTSFTMRADAYVPILDEEFPIDVDLTRETARGLADLKSEAAGLAERYGELRRQVASVDAPQASRLLDQFESQDLQAEIDQLLKQAEVDPDATSTCQVRLRDAQNLLDEVEEELRLPSLVEEARATVQGVAEFVRAEGDSRDQADLQSAEDALDEAITARDRTLIRRQTEVIQRIGIRVLRKSGQFDAVVFGIKEERLSGDPDPEVQRLLAEGRSALGAGDTGRLASVNGSLDRMRPMDEGADAGNPADLISTLRAGGRR